MGVPYAEILGNHSKGLPVRFYTLWADSGLLRPENSGQLLPDRHYDFSAHARNFEELKKIKIYLTRSSTPQNRALCSPTIS